MSTQFDLPVLPDEQGRRRISPTDISQFIRLEQCERYLRLRLHERSAGKRFMQRYGVVPQSIPPLLTRSGEQFEQLLEATIAARWPTIHCLQEADAALDRPHDNERVIRAARSLAPGEVVVLFQPRLQVELGGWLIRGDIDLLRIERTADGALQLLIADMKSSSGAKIEHRLQVAFYYEMLAALLAQQELVATHIAMAVLYRGPSAGSAAHNSPEQEQQERQQRAAAEQWVGTSEALLDLVSDPDGYRAAVGDLLTDSGSRAERAAAASFESLPYHLTYKCDGCLYNEFCMKWSAEHDDLSLLPHLTEHDKRALQREGVDAIGELARLKQFRPAGGDELIPAPDKEPLVRQLSATWPIGPRLDELIHRARRYRAWKQDQLEMRRYMPSRGYGSLPYCAEQHNPNLVSIYIDAQHDYLHDRVYLLGALVIGHEHGQEHQQRRRSVVHLCPSPPSSAELEEQLLVRWIDELLQAIVAVAAPDQTGAPRAPIHLIFFNRYEQNVVLDALSRHFASILGATPLYDFLTQLAAYDSPLATFLDEEIRELKNYPMVCQSLQSVAAYLKFDWNADVPYRDLFRTRLFDFWGKLDRAAQTEQELSPWYTSRARFHSQLPLEYAYTAWGELPESAPGDADHFSSYRGITCELLLGFQARRLEALEWIARDFRGNAQTEKSAFELPNLAEFREKARTLAQALDEFVTIERHVELGGWKAARLAEPERRVLAGETLIVRYVEAAQEPETAAWNRDNAERYQLSERYRAEYRASHPEAKQVRLSNEQRKQTKWSMDGMRVRMQVDLSDVACDLDEALALSTLREGARLVLNPRTTVDSRLPQEQQSRFTPTPKQMLYGVRATLRRLLVERDEQDRAVAAWAELELHQSFAGGGGFKGFVFSSMDRPLVAGQLYTLDPDPNSWYGYWCAKVVEGLCLGQPNTLYQRLANSAAAASAWPQEAAEAQARFFAGLQALHTADALHGFEDSKRDYIALHGDSPTLLVQGPPGTGKSYSTAFALFARLQGAVAAHIPFRVFISCKTHAATNVLLENVARIQQLLRRIQRDYPEIYAAYFDEQLLSIPLLRIRPNDNDKVPDGVIALPRDSERPSGSPRAVDALLAYTWCIAAATPGGIYGIVKDRYGAKSLSGHELCQCLVLDEASQMNLPEAMMAALPLQEGGRLIVVGDHRQMPPIVQHDWSMERRRTFQEYRSYTSLFDTLRQRQPPMIKFAESFRLHAEMAEFLRREIYHQDGIPYHSRRREVLPAAAHTDAFVAAVLAPEHPIVVVVHDEDQSQMRNQFEQRLTTPLIEALADSALYSLSPEEGLGIVVPHRAQRAMLQEALPSLYSVDPRTGAPQLSAVDTVERFQGGERNVIVFSATESDREYLRAASQFLLDPRRLTVALSRARHKLILVASRSIFTLFTPDEETFIHLQLWKNLLRKTCTVSLWKGQLEGVQVEVWGSGADRGGLG